MSIITADQTRISPPSQFDTHTFSVSLSDAEAQVIKNKARKAGIKVTEYIRNAALGFPMG